jgi:thiol-disulfide isomerase/thioredoxin
MKYFNFFILFVFFSCSPDSTFYKKTEADGSSVLIGLIDRSLLFQEFPEWELGLKYYRPDPAVLDSLRKISKDLSIEIFLGTWCGDSRREVPHFFKIIDELDTDLFNNVQLWAVDRSKKIPGSDLAENRNIKYVATFIIYSDDVELGRIIEVPEKTLEEDMLRIIL